MKYLGIDYGDKRIGTAISDREGRIAFPHRMIFNRGVRTASDIKKILNEESISKVVVGLPLNADGGENEQSKKVRAFADMLHREIIVSVEFENEFLTTHMVEKIPGIKKEHTDEAAAALILQSYLDRINKPITNNQ